MRALLQGHPGFPVPPPFAVCWRCPPHAPCALPAGCNKLTDQALLYLRRISNITLIDLRGCKQITRKACEHFISDLSINSLYCLSDEKLIQKIS